MAVRFKETMGIVLAKLVKTIHKKSTKIKMVMGCFKIVNSSFPFEKNSKNKYKNKITANISEGKEIAGPDLCSIINDRGIKNMVML